jgi:D-ribose pyranose/furanose isomerase RbsD
MRIFDIIKNELNADKLKLEEEFERVVNDKSLETNDKVATIKNILKEIAIIEMSFEKFKGYITEDEDDDKITKE